MIKDRHRPPDAISSPFNVRVILTIIPCVPPSNRETIVASPVTVIRTVRKKRWWSVFDKERTLLYLIRLFCN